MDGSSVSIAGLSLGSAAAGICYADRDDLVVIEINEKATTAAVFTRNAFCAAPVTIAKRHLKKAATRYLLINSGNANAGTGDSGLLAAQQTCEILASAGQCKPEQVLPFSTGVIGEHLPVEVFSAGIASALDDLTEDGWKRASKAIMTTDTKQKLRSATVQLAKGSVNITGMAKGSGMIRPDMATMLAYVATDAQISEDDLKELLGIAVEQSFNRISVDGDTSTNDACVLVATGRAGISIETGELLLFQQALNGLCTELARDIVRDGEGATKLINIHVSGGKTLEECIQTGQTVANSPLVKTAFFASDPNWGRILAAVGRAGITDFDINRIQIKLDDVCIVSNGGRAPSYTEEQGQAVMSGDEITIEINLARGAHETTIWTCDFSYDYVKINAEYRT